MKSLPNKIKYLLILSIISFLNLSFLDFSKSKMKYVYTEETNGTKTKTTWKLKGKENQINIEGNNQYEKISIETDKNFNLSKFKYINKSKKTDYTIERENNSLLCSGIVNNKKISDKKNNIGSYAWIQQFGFGLKKFSLSNENKYIFYSVNPNNFSVNKLQAKKQKIENLTINNKNYSAQKISLSLTGFKSLFWTAKIWFDTKDGTMLMYKGNEGPNTPTTTVIFESKEIEHL